MIYFDNGATSLKKPKTVAEEVFRGIASEEIGNPGRGSHRAAHRALSELFAARAAVADIFNLKNPLHVALCQNATAALNLTIKSLFGKTDHIITTAFEHNSVLRPLYRLEKEGAELTVIGIDTKTNSVQYDAMEKAVKKNTRALIVNHSSNVTGALCDLDYVYGLCVKHNLILIADIAQSAGTVPLDISKYTNAVFCFTGHKGLYGPQGTGGIIVNGTFDFKPVFSGGSGIRSFDKEHPSEMPDVFEAGTMNVPAFMGLGAGCRYVKEKGVENIHRQLKKLRCSFLQAVKDIPSIKIYGNMEDQGACVGINIGDIPSGEISGILDERYSIATRPGAHCAPLVHKAFQTEKQGMVRFSFSSFNTDAEIEAAARALYEISRL